MSLSKELLVAKINQELDNYYQRLNDTTKSTLTIDDIEFSDFEEIGELVVYDTDLTAYEGIEPFKYLVEKNNSLLTPNTRYSVTLKEDYQGVRFDKIEYHRLDIASFIISIREYVANHFFDTGFDHYFREHGEADQEELISNTKEWLSAVFGGSTEDYMITYSTGIKPDTDVLTIHVLDTLTTKPGTIMVTFDETQSPAFIIEEPGLV